jgi:hypothetical protein
VVGHLRPLLISVPGGAPTHAFDAVRRGHQALTAGAQCTSCGPEALSVTPWDRARASSSRATAGAGRHG